MNNFATTESEITEMALRLAGAGSQIGLSQGDILGLAAALSSVGIEAEMGGSAISKVMVNMQVAAKTGLGQMENLSAKTGMTRRELELMSSNSSKDFKALANSIGMTTSEMTGIMKASSNLENFGKIAGMSAQEFKKAFEEDAIGAIGKFVEGLGGAEAQGTSAIEMLDEMGIREVRLRDSLLRAGNASDLFKDAVSRSNKAFGENVALTDEANKRYETTESKLKMLKNEAVDAAIDLGGPFVDALRDGLEASKPLIKSLGSMAKSFSSLSEDQQKNIIKWIAVAAAAGPTLKLLGSGVSIIGKVTQSTGKLTGSLVELAAKAAEKKAMESFSTTVATAGTTAAKTAGVGGIGGLTTALGKTAGAATTAAGSSGIGAVTTSLGLLGPALLGVVGVGGALALGYGAWKTFGEEAWNSSERVKRWGLDVGQTTDETLTKMQTNTQNASGEFTLLEQGISTNTESIVTNFSKMGQSIEENMVKKIENLKEIVNSLPEDVKNAGDELTQEEINNQEEYLEIVKTNNEKIQSIREQASNSHRELTYNDTIRIKALAEESATAYVESLGKGQKETQEILKAMTGDVTQATKDQATEWLQSLGEQRQQSKIEYSKMQEDMKNKLVDAGYELNSSYAKKMLNLLETSSNSANQITEDQMATILGKYPELADEVFLANGQLISSMGDAAQSAVRQNKKMMETMGDFSRAAAKTAEENQEKIKLTLDEANEFGEFWNGLVLDKKTGEVKTNAQEAVNEAAESEADWNQLMWLSKDADVSSNVKMMIAEAAIANGKWDSLTFTEQQAMLDSNVTKVMTQALQVNGKWDELTFEQKKAVLYSNTPEVMAETLFNLGLWNDYKTEIKDLNADNYEFLQTLSKSEEKIKIWNETSPEIKELYAKNSDFLNKIFSSEESLKRWNEIPDSEKKLVANNLDFLTKITTSKDSLNKWNELPTNQKNMLADNSDLLNKIFSSKESFEAWKKLPDPVKKMLGNNEDILAKVKDGTISVEDYNKNVLPLLKKILGDNSSLTGAISDASGAIKNYNENVFPNDKTVVGHDKASQAAKDAFDAFDRFKNLIPDTITKTVSADFIGPVQKNAKGTNFHPGGPAMVNDQKGSMYEELVQLPSGNSFIPKGRNVVLDLPRGSKVLKASRTKKLFSRYADGIGNISTVSTIPSFEPLVIAINELTTVLRQQTGVGITTEESVAPKTSTTTDIQSITPEQLEEKTPEFALIGSEWLTNLSDGWNSIVPAYMSNEKLFINQYSTALKIQNTPNYLQGLAWNRNLMNGWNSLTGSFISVINSFCNQAMTTLRSYNSPMYNNGRNWQQNNLNGWNSLYGSFIARVNQLGNDSVNNLRSKSGGYYNAGSFLMQSLINGVNSMGSSLNATMNGVANKMVGGIGKGVNGVISGVNYVLKEVESSKSIGTWTVPQYAKGTEAHPGGLAMINDQKGPVHEEYVQMPDGKGFIAKGRDLLVNLPRGAQVLNASLTKKLKSRLDVPRYENGIGNFDIVDLLDDEKAMQKFLNSKVKYDGIGEPWLDMTKSGVKLMAQSANTMLQSKLSEFFTHGNFDGSMNGNGVYQYLVDVAQKVMSKFPGMTITSGYRPGDAYYHGKHQAIDIALPGVTGGSPIYTQAANYAFEKFPSKIAYVITNGKVRDRMGLSGTGASGNWVNWPDGDHFDHVHLNGSMGSGNIFNAGSGGGGVEKWRSLATKALKMENQYSTANLNALLYQMQTESNGDPRAINLWDDNAKRGTPSKGLMQVIDPTFRSNARAGFNKDIFDPISNILAAIRYTKSTYGSLLAGWKGVGYENGGWITQDGLYRGGEKNKPEMVVPMTKKTRAIELIGEALAFLSGNKNGSTKDSTKSDNSEELLLLIKQQQRQHNELMMILKAILGKDSGIKKSDIGKAANDFLGSDWSKLQYMAGR